MSQYTNKSQQRICFILEALSGHEDKGRTLTGLSVELEISAPMVLRDLKNLEEVGWARQEGSRWYLTAEAAKPAVRVKKNLDSLWGKVQSLHKEFLGSV